MLMRLSSAIGTARQMQINQWRSGSGSWDHRRCAPRLLAFKSGYHLADRSNEVTQAVLGSDRRRYRPADLARSHCQLKLSQEVEEAFEVGEDCRWRSRFPGHRSAQSPTARYPDFHRTSPPEIWSGPRSHAFYEPRRLGWSQGTLSLRGKVATYKASILISRICGRHHQAMQIWRKFGRMYEPRTIGPRGCSAR
jgi:hypothetical protein